MKTRYSLIFSLSLGLLSASAAHAGNTVLGVVVGSGLGAVIGHQVGGRDGTIVGGVIGAATGAIIVSDATRYRGRAHYAPAPVRVYAPAPVYYAPAPVYYAPAPVYVTSPVYYQAPRRVVHVPHPSPRNRHHARHGAHRR
jgi:hypothetical protein